MGHLFALSDITYISELTLDIKEVNYQGLIRGGVDGQDKAGTN